MDQEQRNNMYLLLDSRDAPLANGLLESPKDAPEWRVRILDDKISDVMEHEEIQMVPMADGEPNLLGRILRMRNDHVILKKLQQLDSNMRQNLRMPTRFDTFIYPLCGGWRGRRKVRSNDLSCGGIAFFAKEKLKEREQVEIVIPITSQPLVVRCEILRERPSDQEGETMYAAKFIEMCHDEEMVIREAVFSVQVQARFRSTGA